LGEAWVAPHCRKEFINPLLKKSKTAAVFFYTAPILIIFRIRHFYSRLKFIALFEKGVLFKAIPISLKFIFI